MRRLVFILMIALLPLQGWVSVAMSTEMATMQLMAPSHVAVTSMKVPPECALRMSAANSLGATQDDESNQVCSDCQACHLIALADSVYIANKAAFSVSFERPAGHYFASADLQSGQKPPIFLA